MRPVFCGNFEFDARPSDLERLFRRYGKVDKVDMKSGFAFIYMEDDRDAEYAIRALDRTEFGRKGRRLRVEWTKHERSGGGGGGGGGRKEFSSKRSANLKPSKTLFVINFPYHTKTRDLERHFEPYGKILNVRIRRNFAFVQYESQDDACKALEATNMSKMLDRVISVEYAARDDDDKRNGYSPERRGRDRSPDRRRRSPSPYKRERGSPDYGTGTASSPAAYRRERGSPVYGRGSSHSPRRVERGSPQYERVRSPSAHRVVKASPDFRDRNRSFHRGVEVSPNFRDDSRSLHRGVEVSPNFRDRSRSPHRGVEVSPNFRDLSRSPRGVKASTDFRDRSQSPLRGAKASPGFSDRSRSPRGLERNGNGYGCRLSTSPYRKEEASPVDTRGPRSPVDQPDSREAGELESPLDDRYRSQSPVVRERSRS